jgi:hypothetical protein
MHKLSIGAFDAASLETESLNKNYNYLAACKGTIFIYKSLSDKDTEFEIGF